MNRRTCFPIAGRSPRAAGLLLILAGLLVAIGGAGFAQTGEPSAGTKAALAETRSQARLNPALQEIQTAFVNHIARGRSAQSFTATEPVYTVGNGRVLIEAIAATDASDLLARMNALGLQRGARSGYLVSGRFPIAQLDELARLPDLRYARPAIAITRAGLVTSQGDQASRADLARATFGVDGSGILIGTLSDSFDCLDGAAGDVVSGDLPEGITVVGEISDCRGAIDEGRAMMQIIHDLAPGANQAFRTAFDGAADFANGIRELADAGADIIVDDVGYLTQPMFQNGVIAQAVNEVAAQGVSYFSAAGNSGRNSYENAFKPSAAFGTNGERHAFAEGVTSQRIEVGAGATLLLTLQWDQPYFSVSGAPGSASDLDIFLSEQDGKLLALSQDFNVGNDPVEFLVWTNPLSNPMVVNVSIELFDGPPPGLIKYGIWSNGVEILDFDTNSSTIFGHPNAAGAMAVGAAAYFNTPAFGQDPPLLNFFSSAGPTPLLFDESGKRIEVVLQKPEIVCIDGVNTTFFFGSNDPESDGFPNFFGTSAAAPHAAAIAALLLEAEPTLTNLGVYSALQASAIDMDEEQPGVDDDTGYGLCQADAALSIADQFVPEVIFADGFE
ncbi:MAG: S8 family serine peptidase [Wenzhouxiangellaceae bacterium]|nr:S8 family serine peptidase [Wenzhouxiangellaceae bacterium]